LRKVNNHGLASRLTNFSQAANHERGRQPPEIGSENNGDRE